ncbi:hypothetical protein D9M69_580770 [compost metagenome]
MARQRRHDQHHGLALERGQRVGVVREALEAPQLAEGFVDLDPFVDRDVHPIHVHLVDAEHRFFVVLAQPVHQVVAGGNALRQRQLRQWQHGVQVEPGGDFGQVSERLHH